MNNGRGEGEAICDALVLQMQKVIDIQQSAF